jgi:hypothetical protein
VVSLNFLVLSMRHPDHKAGELHAGSFHGKSRVQDDAVVRRYVPSEAGHIQIIDKPVSFPHTRWVSVMPSWPSGTDTRIGKEL